jgi:hypothetical protein
VAQWHRWRSPMRAALAGSCSPSLLNPEALDNRR